jgi:hypothetical protein
LRKKLKKQHEDNQYGERKVAEYIETMAKSLKVENFRKAS